MALDREKLIAGILPEKEIEIPGKGSITIRALSKGELHTINTKYDGKKDEARQVELQLLVSSLVDPQIDVNDARTWMDSAPAGETQFVLTNITKLSGMETDKKSISGDEESDSQEIRE